MVNDSKNQTAKSPYQNWARTSVILFSGQLASLLGSGLVQFAIIWYVTLRTNSGVAMTLITLAGFVPQLLVAPIAGVWADRFNRKKVMIISDGLIALATLIVAIMFLIGYDAMWLIYIGTAIRSFGGGIHSPAVTAIVPQIVPKDSLVRFNALYHGASNIIQLIAPALGGLVVSFMPMWQIFFIDVITAAIAIFCLLFISVPDHEREKQFKVSQYRELLDGIKYVRSNKLLSAILAVYAAFMILLSPGASLLPLYIGRNFGLDPFNITISQTAVFAGMALGGLIVAKRGKFINKIHVLRVAAGLIALFVIMLGLLGYASWATIWIFSAVLVLFGLTAPFYLTNNTVFIQEEVLPKYQGRTFALHYMVGSFAVPMGTLFFGPLADIVSIQSLFIAAGLTQLILIIATRPLFLRLASHLYFPEKEN